MSAAEAARLLVMYLVVPLWIAAGVADWLCHRRTRIERTSGLPENIFHWILLAEGGVALIATALLAPGPPLLLIVFGAFVAHELTTYLELRYTVARREVRPIEQMVHSFMELLPLALLALLAVIASGEAAPSAPPWPAWYLLAAAAAVLVLNVGPMAEEMVRCLRARRGGS